MFFDQFENEGVLLFNFVVCIEVAKSREVIPQRQEHEMHALNLQNRSFALPLPRLHDVVPCGDDLFLPNPQHEFGPIHLRGLIAPFSCHVYSVVRRPRLQPVALGSFTLAGAGRHFRPKLWLLHLRTVREIPNGPNTAENSRKPAMLKAGFANKALLCFAKPKSRPALADCAVKWSEETPTKEGRVCAALAVEQTT